MILPHRNACPELVSNSELLNWAECHPDPWVREITNRFGQVHDALSSDHMPLSGFSDWYSKLKDQLYVAERDYEEAKDDLDQLEHDYNALLKEKNALIYDLSCNTMQKTIIGLKDEVVEVTERLKCKSDLFHRMMADFESLQSAYVELEKKHEMWTTLVDEHK